MDKHNQLTLFYIHDPMCSWCWGFSPVWKKIVNNLPNEIKIQYLLGGLAPDSNEPMSKSMQSDIAGYWRKVQQHIPDTQFNFDFWEKCQPRRSTYPACRAVIAARKQAPEFELKMLEAIQQGYYLKAENPSDDKTLIKMAMSLALNQQQFSNDLNSKQTQQQLEQEIALSRQLGAQGFPSMIIEKQGKYYRVPLDYNEASIALDFIKELVL